MSLEDINIAARIHHGAQTCDVKGNVCLHAYLCYKRVKFRGGAHLSSIINTSAIQTMNFARPKLPSILSLAISWFAWWLKNEGADGRIVTFDTLRGRRRNGRGKFGWASSETNDRSS